MTKFEKLKSFKITKETAKLINGGNYPSFAQQQCLEAQNWLEENNVARCPRNCGESGRYLDMEYIFC